MVPEGENPSPSVSVRIKKSDYTRIIHMKSNYERNTGEIVSFSNTMTKILNMFPIVRLADIEEK